MLFRAREVQRAENGIAQVQQQHKQPMGSFTAILLTPPPLLAPWLANGLAEGAWRVLAALVVAAQHSSVVL